MRRYKFSIAIVTAFLIVLLLSIVKPSFAAAPHAETPACLDVEADVSEALGIDHPLRQVIRF
jgi:hypothetical protein